MVFVQTISFVSHNFIDLSVEPPPVASKEVLCDDHAKAFTAAVC